MAASSLKGTPEEVNTGIANVRIYGKSLRNVEGGMHRLLTRQAKEVIPNML